MRTFVIFSFLAVMASAAYAADLDEFYDWTDWEGKLLAQHAKLVGFGWDEVGKRTTAIPSQRRVTVFVETKRGDKVTMYLYRMSQKSKALAFRLKSDVDEDYEWSGVGGKTPSGKSKSWSDGII